MSGLAHQPEWRDVRTAFPYIHRPDFRDASSLFAYRLLNRVRPVRYYSGRDRIRTDVLHALGQLLLSFSVTHRVELFTWG